MFQEGQKVVVMRGGGSQIGIAEGVKGEEE